MSIKRKRHFSLIFNLLMAALVSTITSFVLVPIVRDMLSPETRMTIAAILIILLPLLGLTIIISGEKRETRHAI